MLRIFCCSEDPSGDRDDYDFPIYFWGSAELHHR